MRKSTLLALLVIAGCILIGIAIYNHPGKTGYSVQDNVEFRTIEEIVRLSAIAQQDTAKYAEFLRCSEPFGDQGCDSCWQAIYGYSLEFRIN